MANRRPNSCPVDPWKLESDFSDDRPKSVLGRQEKDESKSEDILDAEITARPRYIFCKFYCSGIVAGNVCSFLPRSNNNES